MKGLFIPEITAEMFRNGCLESIEALMTGGKIYDIEYSPWIPVSERLPETDRCYLVTTTGTNNDIIDIAYYTEGIWHKASRIIAWMPLPQPYKAESEDKE